MADGRGLSTTCDSALAAAVKAKAAAEKERETEWWNDALEEVQQIDDSTERRRARAALQAERQRRRDSGEVLASRDALLRHHLVAVLAANGWDKRYPPVPAGEASLPGRRWGTPLENHETGDGQGRLACNLPARLWEQVRRAAYWTSAPAVKELQEWYDRFGDGPGRADREGGVAALGIMMKMAFGLGPRRQDMDRRHELRQKIVTTGDILRAAARAAVE